VFDENPFEVICEDDLLMGGAGDTMLIDQGDFMQD
jgi:hypothetical protein